MTTLEELVKKLGLKPSINENIMGRNGNFVVLIGDCQYITVNEKVVSLKRKSGLKVIEVKPE